MYPSYVSSRLVAALTLTLFFAGCGGGGGGGGDGGDPVVVNPFEKPAIVSTSPAQDEQDVAIDRIIEIVFDAPIDGSQNLDDYFTITVDGSSFAAVAALGPNETVRLESPATFPRDADVDVRIMPGLRDTNGNARETEHAFQFRTEPETVIGSIPHEDVNDPVELMAMKMDNNGDGMSILRQSGGSPRILYREMRAGRSFGPVKVAFSGISPFISEENVHLASNGDVQLTYERSLSGRPNLFAVRYDRSTDTWLPELNLTPNGSSVVAEFASAFTQSTGIIAWTEQSITDNDRQAVSIGFPNADGTMGAPFIARLADTKRTSLRVHKQDELSLIAWSEATASGTIATVIEHRESTGFSSIMPLSHPVRHSSVRQVIASQNGNRYVLFEQQDPSNTAQGQLYVTHGAPGSLYTAPAPLHGVYARVHSARMVVTPSGTMTVVYGIDGAESGTWMRRFVPGQAPTAPLEISGADAPVQQSDLALTIDTQNNAYALWTRNSALYQQLVRASIFPAVGNPMVNIPVDTNVRKPARSGLRLTPLSTGEMLLTWIYRVDAAAINDDVRARTLSPSGQLGTVETYGIEREVLITRTAVGVAQTGTGTLLYAEQLPFDVYEIELE